MLQLVGGKGGRRGSKFIPKLYISDSLTFPGVMRPFSSASLIMLNAVLSAIKEDHN